MMWPTPAQIRQLPQLHRVTIPPAYRDPMGHMNVQYYMKIWDDAGWALFADWGLDLAYFEREQAGLFALEQHIRYLAEVRVGETVTVHIRLVNLTAKRIHLLVFLVNESTDRLAATLEEVTSHADLRLRRTSPFPPPIAARLQTVVNAHNRLDWAPPLCGTMRA